jgi:hypothetical protein
MRRISVLVVTSVLVTSAAAAQLVHAPTPPPVVTAANAAWQLRGDPVLYSGAFYDASGPTTFFDGNVMVRSGEHEGVPVYVDATSTTYTIVYVPVGGKLMRPYARRREGDLAGSGTLPLPVASSLAAPATDPGTGVPNTPPDGTAGVAAPSSHPATRASVQRPTAESIPGPSSNTGIWISYRGMRWHSAGAAVSYSADRFVRIGQYRGLPVYRDRHGPADQVYIPAVKDGPLAPFRK